MICCSGVKNRSSSLNQVSINLTKLQELLEFSIFLPVLVEDYSTVLVLHSCVVYFLKHSVQHQVLGKVGFDVLLVVSLSLFLLPDESQRTLLRHC